MSTLLDQINANTEAIKTGKNTVVDAITAKGGVVNSSGSVPTFKEIANGVSSINTSGGGSGGGTEIITKYVYTAGNGATDITAFAVRDISMKDTVAVLKNTGEGVSYVGLPILPSVGRVDKTDSTYTEHTLDYSVDTYSDKVYPVSNSSAPRPFYNSRFNSVICVGSSAGTAYYFPFYKKGDTYKQLKINGSYKSLGDVSRTRQSSVAYDEDNKILYVGGSSLTVYKLDEDTLNLTTLTTVASSHTQLWCHNSNLFYGRYCKKFDETTNTFSTTNTIIPTTLSYYYIVDYIEVSDTSIYLLIGDGYNSVSNTSIYLYKLTLDANGVYQVAYSTFVSSKVGSCGMPDPYRIFLYTSSDGLTIKHIMDYGTKFGSFGTDTTSDLFLDDTSVFDYSTITDFRIDKSGYMQATTASNRQLLKTEFSEAGVMLGYSFLAIQNTDFNPVSSGVIKGMRCNTDFNYGWFLNSSDGVCLLYKGYREGGDYLVQGANNRLSDSQNLYGYGIAKENIAKGDTGIVSLGFLA